MFQINGSQISYQKGNISYKGRIVIGKTNLQYVLMYPENLQDDKTLVVQSLNFGRNNRDVKDITDRGVQESLMNDFEGMMNWFQDAPIVIPIVPNIQGNVPDYQQLSIECFLDEMKGKRDFERIDLQYLECIESAKKELEKMTGKRVLEKVFLNGYSSSGVFAQRFALIHPEVVDKCCIGGATGSIPVPEDNIGYPIGIADFEELFGCEFNRQAYQDIDFAYYVGEYEAYNPGNWDINGNAIERDNNGIKLDESQLEAPMHDMSYRGHSISKEVGRKQRELYGRDLNERFKNSIQYYQDNGYKIVEKIFKGIGHRGIFNARKYQYASEVVTDIKNFYNGNPAFEHDIESTASNLDMSKQHRRETKAPQSRLGALANQKKELESILRKKQAELETKQANISPYQNRSDL